jgi:hypothetical protein
MFITATILFSGAFALITAVAARRGDRELISHRPYENVRDGMPRSARSTGHLDL